MKTTGFSNPQDKGLASADRNNKTTLLLTAPSLNKVVYNGFVSYHFTLQKQIYYKNIIIFT